MCAGQGRQGTAGPTNDDPAVAFDMRQRSEMLIQHGARGGDAGFQASTQSFPSRQFESESFASASEERHWKTGAAKWHKRECRASVTGHLFAHQQKHRPACILLDKQVVVCLSPLAQQSVL